MAHVVAAGCRPQGRHRPGRKARRPGARLGVQRLPGLGRAGIGQPQAPAIAQQGVPPHRDPLFCAKASPARAAARRRNAITSLNCRRAARTPAPAPARAARADRAPTGTPDSRRRIAHHRIQPRNAQRAQPQPCRRTLSAMVKSGNEAGDSASGALLPKHEPNALGASTQVWRVSSAAPDPATRMPIPHQDGSRRQARAPAGCRRCRAAAADGAGLRRLGPVAAPGHARRLDATAAVQRQARSWSRRRHDRDRRGGTRRLCRTLAHDRGPIDRPPQAGGSSRVVALCITQRLSHITTSPGDHCSAYWDSGWVQCANRRSSSSRLSSAPHPATSAVMPGCTYSAFLPVWWVRAMGCSTSGVPPIASHPSPRGCLVGAARGRYRCTAFNPSSCALIASSSVS